MRRRMRRRHFHSSTRISPLPSRTGSWPPSLRFSRTRKTPRRRVQTGTQARRAARWRRVLSEISICAPSPAATRQPLQPLHPLQPRREVLQRPRARARSAAPKLLVAVDERVQLRVLPRSSASIGCRIWGCPAPSRGSPGTAGCRAGSRGSRRRRRPPRHPRWGCRRGTGSEAACSAARRRARRRRARRRRAPRRVRSRRDPGEQVLHRPVGLLNAARSALTHMSRSVPMATAFAIVLQRGAGDQRVAAASGAGRCRGRGRGPGVGRRRVGRRRRASAARARRARRGRGRGFGRCSARCMTTMKDASVTPASTSVRRRSAPSLCTRTIVSTAWLCVSATFALTSAILSAGSSSTSNLAFVLGKIGIGGRGQHLLKTRDSKRERPSRRSAGPPPPRRGRIVQPSRARKREEKIWRRRVGWPRGLGIAVAGRARRHRARTVS